MTKVSQFSLRVQKKQARVEEELTNDYIIRRTAVDFAIALFTNVQLARRFVEAISRKSLADLQIKSWREYR